MKGLLEEMISTAQRSEPIFELPLKPGIEKAYRFEISPERTRRILANAYEKEYTQCEEMRKRSALLKEPTTCFYIQTDSSSAITHKSIYENYIKKCLTDAGFDECDFQLPLIEAYKNAVIHGNKGGNESDYMKREGTKPTKDREKNRGDPIEVEVILTKEFYLLRVIDCGKGFDVSKIQAGMDGNIMAGEGRGLKMAASLTDCMIGNHYENPQRFALTIVKYKSSPQKAGECIVRL